MKYRIYVSDNELAENLDVMTVETNKDLSTVVMAVAFSTIYDRELDEDDIENIGFYPSHEKGYMVIICTKDYHISVWGEECCPQPVLFLESIQGFIDIAKNTKMTDVLYDNDPEMKKLLSEIYAEGDLNND